MKKNSVEDTDYVYHHSKSLGLFDFGIVSYISISVSLLFFVLANSYLVSGTLFLGIFYLMLNSMSKEKTSYKLYKDRIEFFSKYYIEDKQVVKMSDIFQVRYEDEFGDNYNAPKTWMILIYLKPSHNSNYKKINKSNYFSLSIFSHNRVEEIIKILSLFQKEKKQVFVQTKYKRIKEELGLKNWNGENQVWRPGRID